MNGDTYLDLLFALPFSSTIGVILGDGKGGFVPGGSTSASGPGLVMAGDLDGDGDIDFIATDQGNGSATIGLNKGDATFVTTTVPTGTAPLGLWVGDFDSDGDIDFVSLNNTDATVSLHLNNGDATFQPGKIIVAGYQGDELLVADLDGDNALDIGITDSAAGSEVSIFLNDGAANFTVATPVPTDSNPHALTSGDVNGDGRLDLVVAKIVPGGSVSVFLGDGSGGFTSGDTFNVQDSPYDVQMGDLDMDGDLDMVVSNAGSASLSVFLNDGMGTFTELADSPLSISPANQPAGITLADFDDDGDLDISTANYSGSTSIFLNTSATYSVAATAPTSTVEGTPPGAGGQLVFTISRTASSEAEDVTYTLGGKANAADFTDALGGTVSFIAGQTTATVTLDITPDATVEADETVVLTLTGVVTTGDAVISATANEATGTILNDDNTVPVSKDDSYSLPEDSIIGVGLPGVLGNDSDADGDTLTAALVSDVSHGTLSFSANGGFTYTPNANFHGTDSFTYKANDGTAEGNTVTVTLTVTSENDAVPVSKNDSYSVNEDTKLTITAPGVLSNDSDADGDAMTVSVVTGPTNGTLTLNPDGSFDYTPNANFHGTDSFTYKANDGTGDGNTATVNLTVNSVNDAVPVSKNDSYSVNEDTKLTITAPGVLSNDSDVDGDAMTVAVVTGPTNGTLTLNPDGSFDYTPNADFHGTDTFTYKANDGTGDGNTATVNLTVNPVNDAPVSIDNFCVATRDTPLVLAVPGLLDNDFDVDGDPLTAILVTGPTNGTLALNLDGSFTYTPDAGYVGADSFTYKANDGTVDGNIATVWVTVAAGSTGGGNQPALFTGEVLGRVVEAGTASPGIPTASGDLLVNDPDGLNIVQPIVAGTRSVWGYGTVEMSRDGVWTYTLDNANPTVDRLATGETLTDRFVALAADGTQQVIVITIHGVDDGRAIIGTPEPDTLTGTPDDDVIRGLAGRDTLTGGAGDDSIDGGRGLDTALFSGALAGYRLTRIDERTVEIVDIDPSDGDDGTDILSSIEMLRFGGADPVTIGSLAGQPDWTLERDDVGVTAATYQLFLHGVPAAGGFDYLVMSDVNTTDLNDPYYFIFNLENRYLNFASNLGTASPEGAAWFDAEYGALTYEQAVEKAFAAIVSADALRAIGADPAVALDFFRDGQDFFEAVAAERVVRPGVDLAEATKIVMLGSMLYEAVKANVGSYGQAVNDFADIVYASGTHEDLGTTLFQVG